MVIISASMEQKYGGDAELAHHNRVTLYYVFAHHHLYRRCCTW
jgi:hypothetical protein